MLRAIKLQRVTGSGTQYTYDANGNMLTDELNQNRDIKYDHRNLITQIRNKKIIIEDSLVYVTYYFYDEAGNRIRKNVYQYIGIQPSDSVETPDLGDITDMTGYWDLIKDEVYSRDLSGKEVALYVNGNIMQNNIWGLGNEGYITSAGALNFYLKDHLGSIRAVTDENNSLISGQDYDAWGYILQGREYHSEGSVYKFTGKERDQESEYDYFGARYGACPRMLLAGDARIGRWGTVDPLQNKYPTFTPYCYTLNNPIILSDPTGLWIPNYNPSTNNVSVVAEEGDNLQNLYNQLGISGDDFGKTYDINNVNEYSVIPGETNFDITNFVIQNSNFDANFTNSNCFGFVNMAITPGAGESQMDYVSLSKKISSETSNPISGDIALFDLSDDLIFKEDNTTIAKKGDIGHAAIYVIADRSGNKYFLNRVNTYEKVTIMKDSQISGFFRNIINRYKDMYLKEVSIYGPRYYKKAE